MSTIRMPRLQGAASLSENCHNLRLVHHHRASGRGPASGRVRTKSAKVGQPSLGTEQQNQSTFQEFVMDMQQRIIQEAQQIDGSGTKFVQDKWQRDGSHPNPGYGVTAVLEGGGLLEKAAINTTVVSGTLSATRAQAMSGRGRGIDPEGGQQYSACAMSLVFHVAHPMVPTLRADVRVFAVEGNQWFGGGCDLTPSYLFEDDAAQFHAYWKGLCDKYSPELYPQYKALCDSYFYLKARSEHRGIGGIFYDDLSQEEGQFSVQAFTQSVAEGILPSWLPIAERRRQQEYSQANRQWQLLRRGRYIEFNLLYDRGVRFGLDSGRIESIMVSAPPLVAWQYNVLPEAGSPEEKLVQVLRNPRDWA